MATTYVKEFGGYIADVPRMWFRRCDGKIFEFNELTQASVTPQIQTVDINAGWSLYPVAVLPGQSTLEMQCTSGKFEADLFAMTNATNFEKKEDYEIFKRKTDVADESAFTIEIEDEVLEDETKYISGSTTAHLHQISINGMEEATAAAAGKYKVEVTAATETVPGKTTITFAEGDVKDGDTKIEFEIQYKTKVEARVAEIDNKASAVGEAVLAYPVYSDGSDCTESGILGYVFMHLYRARVTAQPGLNGSYKSASTFEFTLSAMDPKRDDGMIYNIAYVKNPDLYK